MKKKLKDKIFKMFRLSGKEDALLKQKESAIMDYSEILQLKVPVSFKGEEYYIQGFGGDKFTNVTVNLELSDKTYTAFRNLGTARECSTDLLLVEQEIRRINLTITKFYKEVEGNAIIYAETIYDKGIHTAYGWKLFCINGEWKLCVSYRLI